MRIPRMLQRRYDALRPNRYALDPYLINDGEKHPFAVICPGGGYSEVCSFCEGRPFAEKLNRLGYHAFVVYYRVKDEARYPNPQDDLGRAIEEIFAHAEEWRLDIGSWSVWGSSAGGHLVASYFTEKRKTPKPTALVLVYPVITMGEYTHKGSKNNLLGKNAGKDMTERLSVEKHINSDYPPVFVWYGTADNTVDTINAKMLSEALGRASVPHKTEEYEGIGHGAGLAEGTVAEQWFNNAVEFWEEQSSTSYDSTPTETFMNSRKDKCGELYYKNGCFTYVVMEKLFDDYEGHRHYYWSPAQTPASFFDTKEKAVEEILSEIEK